MMSFRKSVLVLSLGALLGLGTSAYAQNVQPQSDGPYYYIMPGSMMGMMPGGGYGMMNRDCPYYGMYPQYNTQNPANAQNPTVPVPQNAQPAPTAPNAFNAQLQPQTLPQMPVQPAQSNDDSARMPSLALGLDLLGSYLQLNDQQQDAFDAYAKAAIQARQSIRAANAALAAAQNPQQRLDAQIQNLKDRIGVLENVSKLRQALVSTLAPSQVQLLQFTESHPRAALAQAYILAQQNAAQLAAMPQAQQQPAQQAAMPQAQQQPASRQGTVQQPAPQQPIVPQAGTQSVTPAAQQAASGAQSVPAAAVQSASDDAPQGVLVVPSSVQNQN